MSAITLAGTSGRDRDRDTDQVKIKSEMLHNPPDDVNFLRHPWNGSHRQLFNFLTSFTNELKAQSLFRLTLFDKFKEKQRPNAAYRRVDDRTNTRDDDKDIEKYEEHEGKDTERITKANIIVQMLVTQSIYQDFTREINRLERLAAPAYTQRQVFWRSTYIYFPNQYSSNVQIIRTKTNITKEITGISVISSLHNIMDLITTILSKNEQCIRMATWMDDNEHLLRDSDLRAILFSKLTGPRLDTILSLIHTFDNDPAVPKTFRQISDHIRDIVSNHDLDSVEQQSAYGINSCVNDLTHTDIHTDTHTSHALHYTTHDQEEYMQHQFEVNANAQGQNCHNCGL